MPGLANQSNAFSESITFHALWLPPSNQVGPLPDEITDINVDVVTKTNRNIKDQIFTGMLILVRVLIRTPYKDIFQVLVLVLVLVIGGQVLVLVLGGQVLVLILVLV